MSETYPLSDRLPAATSNRHLIGSFAVVAAITIWRILCLWFTPLDLFMDEAQYWLWGRDLAFGYFSKPPLIGWGIRAVTGIAGSDSAFWVRLISPLGHALAALLVGFAARAYWRREDAIWAAAAYATLPGVAILTLFVSTDDLLLPAFAGALLALIRLRQNPASRGWAVALGIALGAGLLAKYAMVYFVVTLALLALTCGDRLLRRGLLVAILIGLAMIAPNLIWNLSVGFVTFGHTAENAGWSGMAWNLPGMIAFLATQALAFGPIFALAYVPALRRTLRQGDWPLALLSAGILGLIALQALIRSANGNWAAPAFVAATVMTLPWALQHWPRWTKLGLWLNAALAVLLPAMTLAPDLLRIRGQSPFDRIEVVSAFNADLTASAKQAGVKAILSDDRMVLATLTWQLRDAPLPVYALPPQGAPRNHYEMTHAAPADLGPVLLVSRDLPAGCEGRAQELAAPHPANSLRNLEALHVYRLDGACWR